MGRPLTVPGAVAKGPHPPVGVRLRARRFRKTRRPGALVSAVPRPQSPRGRVRPLERHRATHSLRRRGTVVCPCSGGAGPCGLLPTRHIIRSAFAFAAAASLRSRRPTVRNPCPSSGGAHAPLPVAALVTRLFSSAPFVRRSRLGPRGARCRRAPLAAVDTQSCRRNDSSRRSLASEYRTILAQPGPIEQGRRGDAGERTRSRSACVVWAKGGSRRASARDPRLRAGDGNATRPVDA